MKERRMVLEETGSSGGNKETRSSSKCGEEVKRR